jgi:hypothetical protein
MWNSGGLILTGENQRTLRKTCPSATLSNTNPLGANLGLCGEKLATDCLSYDTACGLCYLPYITHLESFRDFEREYEYVYMHVCI